MKKFEVVDLLKGKKILYWHHEMGPLQCKIEKRFPYTWTWYSHEKGDLISFSDAKKIVNLNKTYEEKFQTFWWGDEKI